MLRIAVREVIGDAPPWSGALNTAASFERGDPAIMEMSCGRRKGIVRG